MALIAREGRQRRTVFGGVHRDLCCAVFFCFREAFARRRRRYAFERSTNRPAPGRNPGPSPDPSRSGCLAKEPVRRPMPASIEAPRAIATDFSGCPIRDHRNLALRPWPGIDSIADDHAEAQSSSTQRLLLLTGDAGNGVDGLPDFYGVSWFSCFGRRIGQMAMRSRIRSRTISVWKSTAPRCARIVAKRR